MKKIFSIFILAVAGILAAQASQVVKVVYNGTSRSITFRTNNVSASRVYYARSTSASPSFSLNVTPTNSGNYSTFSISSGGTNNDNNKTIQIQLDDAVTFFEITSNPTYASTIDFSNATNLASISLKGCTGLTAMTLGTMSALTDIDVSNTSAAVANAITAAKCPALENLNVANCGLSSLTYTGTTLYALDITGNSISTLDLSGNSNLDIVRCESNSMTSLTTSAAVTTVSAQSNILTTLTGYGEAIQVLDVASNGLNTLSMDGLDGLTDLDISSNHLTFRSFPSAENKPARMLYTGNDGQYDLSDQMRTAFGSYSYPLQSKLPNYAARNETHYTVDLTEARLDGDGVQSVVPVANSYNGSTDTPLTLATSDVDGNDYAKSTDGNLYGFMKAQSRVRFSFTNATYPGLTLYSNEFTVPDGVTGTLQIVDNTGTALYTISNAMFSDAIEGIPAEAQREYTKYTIPAKPTTAGQTWTITAGPSDDAPFAWAKSYDAATWYYMSLGSGTNKWATAGESNGSAGTAYGGHALKSSYSTTDNYYKWAFVGNQYDGFKIYNKGCGNGQTLQDYSGYMTPTSSGMYPIMRSGTSLTWIVRSNSSGDGFSLENKTGGTDGGVSAPCYLNNYAGNGYMNYWITNNADAQNDAGSLFSLIDATVVESADVKICYGENLETTYGSWSGNTWTSNVTSGMAGVTMTKTGGSFYNYGNVTGYKDMSYYTGGTETVTLAVPAGYVITGYSAKLRQANGSASSYTLTTAGGDTFTPPVANAIGGYMDMVVSDVNTNSTTLTIANSNASNVLGFVNFVVSVALESTADVKIVYGTNGETTYGSWSGNTWTSNAESGMAGVTLTLSDGSHDKFSSLNSRYNLAYHPAAANTNSTLTLTAPDGYVITGYSVETGVYQAATYTLTPSGGTAITPANLGSTYTTLSASGLSAASATITVNTTDASKWLALANFTVQLAREVSVTWNVLDAENFTKLTVTKKYPYNSTVSAYPSELTAYADRFVSYPALTPFTVTSSQSKDVTYTWTGPFQISTTGDEHHYQLKIRNALYITSNTMTGGQLDCTTSSEVTNDQRWMFFGDPFNGFILRNYAKNNQALAAANGTATDGSSYPTFESEGTRWIITTCTQAGYTNPFSVAPAGTTGVYWNQYGGVSNNQGLKYWSATGSSDGGAAVQAIEIVDAVSEVPITWIVVDGDDNEMFSTTVNYTAGSTISSYPTALTDYENRFVSYPALSSFTADTPREIEIPYTWTGPFTLTTDVNSPNLYYFKSARYGYYAYAPAASDGSAKQSSQTKNVVTPRGRWFFTGDPFNGIEIRPYAHPETGLVNNTLSTTPTKYIPRTAPDITTNYWDNALPSAAISFVLPNNTSSCLAEQLGTWSSASINSDKGLSFVVEEADDISTLVAPGYYRVRCMGSGLTTKYWKLGDGHKLYNNGATNDPSSVFRIEENVNADNNLPASWYIAGFDGDAAWYFDNSRDSYSQQFTTTQTEENYVPAQIEYNAKSGDIPYYAIKLSTQSSYSGYSYANTNSNGTTVVTWVKTEGTADGSAWTFEPYTMTLRSVDDTNYYSTAYLPFDYTLPKGVKAYTITVSGNMATAHELTGGVPAGTGVLLVGNGTGNLKLCFDGYSAPGSISNDLTGTYEDIPTPSGGAYVFSAVNNVPGFYKFSGSTLSAYKAYIPIGAGSKEISGFTIVFDENGEVTGIDPIYDLTNDNLTIDNTDGPLFNLQGQRVNTPKRGIYIVNGKKVVVK